MENEVKLCSNVRVDLK